MIFTIFKDDFDTFAQWYTWGMGSNLSILNKVIPQDSGINRPDSFAESEQDLYYFFQDLYADIYEFPQKYSIPIEDYNNDTRTNEKRLNVARVVKAGVLDFLLKIGQIGELSNDNLIIESSVYNELLESKKKKITRPLFQQTRNSIFGRVREIAVLQYLIIAAPYPHE